MAASFGSFHTSDTLTQLKSSEDDYQPPPLPPIAFPAFKERVDFGNDMKKKHFFLDADWTFINHGAFGAVLRECIEAQREWQMHVERQPLKFLDREFFPQLIHVVTRVAKFIDAARTDVVFVQNATTGSNAVIQSVVKTLKPGDAILKTNVTYGTVRKLLDQVGEERGLRIDEARIKFPMESAEDVITAIREAITPETKLAVLDHIPSMHGVVLPIKEMIAACHDRGVQVLVDAAHCLGSIPISMRDIGADYYVVNAHKWFCSSKGCCVLYVDKKHHSIIHPLLVSWGHGCGFNSEFGWTGLMDYTSYLSMHTVLDFWEFYGVDNMREYMYKTAREAGELLTRSWGTKLLADSKFFRMMVVVGLPDGLVPPPPHEDREKPVYAYKHAVMVQNTLHNVHKIEVPIKAIEGQLYVRISVHVYNCIEDYEKLASTINKMRDVDHNIAS